MATVSFEHDIMPFFKQYQGQMQWRLDLTKYEDVKLNAELIKKRINPQSGDRMPPPPFDPFPDNVFIKFSQWIDEGFPP